MEYTKIRNTDIQISKLTMGCMSFGRVTPGYHQWVLNLEDTEKIIMKAIEKGINFFDTANSYSNGSSEEFLGEVLKKNNVSRDKVVISSKVYKNPGALSREAIFREIDGTLSRLQTDYLDLYMIHRFDYNTPIEETMEALDDLIKAGKVRAIGASSMFGYQFYNMQQCAKDNGWQQFVTMQNHYNLLYREDERELMPVCRQFNVTLMPHSVLAAGRLARRNWETDSLRSQVDTTARRKYDVTKQQDEQISERVAELAEKYSVSMSQIALAWLYEKGVDTATIGVTKEKYLDDLCNCFDVKLNEEDVRYLEELYYPHPLMGPAVK